MPKWNLFLRLQTHNLHIMRRLIYCSLSGLLISLPAFSADKNSKTLDKAVNETALSHQQGAESQSVILKSKETTRQLLSEFQTLNQTIDQLKINHAHLVQTQTQQLLTINSLTNQLNEIEVTEKAIVPHLLSMVDWLDSFVDQDMPFHSEERQQRIAYLKSSMVDPDVGLPERYRRVLEAYQVESEYGYTIEAYPYTISLSGEKLNVKLLRVGRIGLYYQSEDGQYSGYWHHQNKAWETGQNGIKAEIENGLLIAQKQRPHSLLTLPVVK